MIERETQTNGKLTHALKLFSLCLGLMLAASCASHPVEEIVTTDASRSSVVPPGAQPVAHQPDLPARDADIEVAGDRIAEARTYLNSRRRDRREVALRALNQAETAINRALRARAHDDETSHTALRGILRDLDTAERAVQRGASDAARQLAALDKTLDNLNLPPVTPEEETQPEASPSPSP